MLLSSPAGNDLLFDEALCLQGRNFSNKIWNSFRLIQGWEVDENIPQPAEAKIAIEWFHSRFNKELDILDDHYSKFRLSDALMTTYKLVWNDFCSWYLEMVKPEYQKPIDRATLDATVEILEKLLKVLHPFTPFITEEIWDNMGERTKEDRMIVSAWPKPEKINDELLVGFELAEKAIMEIRRIRNEKQIAPKEKLNLLVKGNWNSEFNPVISKLANLERIETTNEAPASAAGFVVKGVEFFVPLEGLVDEGEEKEKLQKELEYTRGFLNSVTKKLSNERFVSGAPEQVVAAEKNKKADAEAKIKALEEQLAAMA
jgi:valyl-tRNA synthetase